MGGYLVASSSYTERDFHTASNHMLQIDKIKLHGVKGRPKAIGCEHPRATLGTSNARFEHSPPRVSVLYTRPVVAGDKFGTFQKYATCGSSKTAGPHPSHDSSKVAMHHPPAIPMYGSNLALNFSPTAEHNGNEPL